MERSSPLNRIEACCPSIGQGSGDGAPLVAPITQSTTFSRDGLESQSAHAYSRVSNPTLDVLEQALGDLETALPSVCFGTGLAAETALFLALLRAGDHVICGRGVYGGTTRLLQRVFSNLGVSTSFIDATCLSEIECAVRPETQLIFIESPSNPALELTDVRGVSAIAQRAGAVLALDNTFLTPALQQPLDLGVDISVYSTTKFIEGHSLALGGALTTRDSDLQERLRFIRKCIGSAQSPFNAWLTLQGLRTLPLRVRRSSESAAQVARWLESIPEVRAVRHPSLESHPQRDLADSQHAARLHGGVISFDLADERAVRGFLSRLQFIRLVEHVGSVETIITHSASMTHADVDPADRAASGIGDGLLRLSIGLEPSDSIIADLERGFDSRTACSNSAQSNWGATCAAIV